VRLRLEPGLKEFREAVAAGAAATVAPLAELVDREQRFSPELWGAIRDLGLAKPLIGRSMGLLSRAGWRWRWAATS
jgi:alkylation response protein AidB-like acyl-CoA dehydrogenase